MTCHWPFSGWSWIIFEEINQHRVCWCSGSWYDQVIDKYDIVYVEWGCLCREWLLTTLKFWGIFVKYVSFSLRRTQYTKGLLHHMKWYIDGLVQERHNSSALAMELHLHCNNPAIYCPNQAYFHQRNVLIHCYIALGIEKVILSTPFLMSWLSKLLLLKLH